MPATQFASGVPLGVRVIATCPGPFCCVSGVVAKHAADGGCWVKVNAAEWPTDTPRVFTDNERANWMYFEDFELEVM